MKPIISYNVDPVIGPQIDITAPKAVEVEWNAAKTVLWVNVDGVCRLRVCQIPHVESQP